ncbi:MAG: beta-propeller domain-containing protein [Lysinibacillus sp.]
MRKKWIGIYVLAILCLVPVLIWLFVPKSEAMATGTVLTNQNWSVYFSKTLKSNSTKSKFVYITNEEGQKVDASVKLGKDKKSLVVSKLKPGEYTLNVRKKAFVQIFPNTKSHELEFTVIEKLQGVASKKALKQYFEVVLNYESVGIQAESEKRLFNSKEDKAESSGGNSSDQSTTNNQVEGVEEGDIVVVNDGYIYAARENQLVITNAKNPKELKQLAGMKLGDHQYISKLAVYDNLLIVIADEYLEKESATMTAAHIYNIEDPTKPKLVRKVAQEGYLNDVRVTASTLYMISNMHPDYWMLREGNYEEKGLVPRLQPQTYDSLESAQYEELPLDKIQILPNTLEASYSVISAIDLKNGAQQTVDTKAYLGSSNALYMSEDALYLTAPQYDINSNATSKSSQNRMMSMVWRPQNANTQIFKWQVDGTDLTFVSTTEVVGTVLNQYSMDEYNKHFRIVTTEGNNWDEKSVTKNHLFILDDKLQQVGAVKDLAPSEKVYSARFMGDKAYIVTFKQVDPLFVIDVANPKNPTVLGELKIPGYSNYLHPLDETHLIGIGYDTEERVDDYSKETFTVSTNMKMTLFDVTDFHNPKEQSTVKIGGIGSSSEVQNNPKALFRHSAYNYYGFPVVLYEAGSKDEVVYQGDGALIYEVTSEKGITLKGNLIKKAENEPYEDWGSVVQRIVYVDEALFTISPSEVKSYKLSDFSPLDTMKIK